MAIRRAKAEDASRIAKVHVDSWRTTYAGIVPEKFLQEMSYEVFEERWSRWLAEEDQPAEVTFYVAELQAGEVVGFACGGPNRSQEYPNYEGELYAAYLFKEYQRRGLGSLLLSAVVEELAAAGQNSMLAWVLAQNPSRDPSMRPLVASFWGSGR